MEISLNWLEEWVDLGGIEADELAHRLTMAGLEVDAIETIGADAGRIVVGRIDAVDAHPDADRLVLCDVDIGDGTERQIACGAPNVSAGSLVPVALPGSRPPGLDFEIGRREVRGEISEGMICSAEELGIEEESEGILELSGDLELGADLFEVLELRDTIIEFDLTPNRSDCLSHLGVAREVKAIWDRPLREPEFGEEPYIWEATGAASDALEAASLEVRDPEGCPRYAFAVADGIEVGPSPLWLKRRLAAVGVRSVNNIVDVTNYVLLDVGQPLHAFDLDELRGDQIVVRRAQPGETLVGIDHETYELDPDDLVIADAERPVALAGVMGGAETEVGASTERILMECAFFEPESVRRASKRHALHTESSHRFERGIDPSGIEPYLDRAMRAVSRAQDHFGGNSEPRVFRNIGLESVEGATEPWSVTLPKGLSERVLGASIGETEVRDSLDRLDLAVDESGESFEVRIPTHRGDLRRPVDLVEEVARLYGYDRVAESLPHREMGGRHERRTDADHGPTLESRERRSRVRRVRERLLDAGLAEVVNPSFMAQRELEQLRVPEEDRRREVAEVANPLRSSERYMRTTLLPGLLRVLETNRSQKRDDVAIFEFGRRYFSDVERSTIGLLLAGRALNHWSERRAWDFFDLKGLVEGAGQPFELGETSWQAPDEAIPWLHPGIQARWSGGAEGTEVFAEAGRLHPEIAREMELEGPVLVAEVYWDALEARSVDEPVYEEISTYPPVDRDVALIVDCSVGYREVHDAIVGFRDEDDQFDELVASVELFDVYEGEQVPDGKRSLAFSIRYRAGDRTLTEQEVAPLDDGLIAWLGERLGAERR